MRTPILMYHSVTPRPQPAFRKYSVTPAAFAAQMRWLARAGHVPATLDQLLLARSGQQPLPRRAVVITFDDGFQDCVDYAAPILATCGFTALFFLVAGLVGRSSAWLAAERNIDLPLMDWAAARRLEAAGLHCGAHSLSHPHLADLGLRACRSELFDSKRMLEDQLGHSVAHLAYPYGSYNDDVRSIAADCGYQSACSVRIGLSAADDDILALHRVPISGQESFLDFISRLYTSLPLRDALRAGGAAARQRAGLRPAPAAS